jgi:hypothetical protein
MDIDYEPRKSSARDVQAMLDDAKKYEGADTAAECRARAMDNLEFAIEYREYKVNHQFLNIKILILIYKRTLK